MAGQPEKRIQVGSVHAAIFANEGKEGRTFRKVTVQKRYKDKDGKWQSASSFTADELPEVILALQKAYEHLKTPKQSNGGGEGEDSADPDDIY